MNKFLLFGYVTSLSNISITFGQICCKDQTDLGNMYNFQGIWSHCLVPHFSSFLGWFYENVRLLSISCYLPKIMKIDWYYYFWNDVICNYRVMNCTATYLILSTIIIHRACLFNEHVLVLQVFITKTSAHFCLIKA